MFDTGWEDGLGDTPVPSWSRRVPGPELAAALMAAEPVDVEVDEGFDAAERFGAWEALAAWATARQCREVADYLVAREGQVEASSRDPGATRPGVAMELAAYARVAPATGEHRLDLATALAQRLPLTLAALEAGRISYSHARAMVTQTAQCDEEMARRVDAELWGRPARERTPSQLREAVRRIVARLDPENLRRRAHAAHKDRSVRYWPDDDGATGVIELRMPAPEARGVWAVVDALAHRAGDQPDGEARSLGNKRADVLRDIVLTGALEHQPADVPGEDVPGEAVPGEAEPGEAAPGDVQAGAGSAGRPERAPSPVSSLSRVGVVVRLTMPWQTAAGLSELPGELEGHGPIPADQARALAYGALSGDPVWQRLLTDPVSGAVERLDQHRYRPSRRLAEHVRTRDRTCRAPGCRVPASRCDLDHVIAYRHDAPAGDGGVGATTEDNLDPLCRRHHWVKTHTGWRCEMVSDPNGSRAPAVRWISPAGRAWIVPAPTLDQPDSYPQVVERVAA